jgi:hypothetical protein
VPKVVQIIDSMERETRIELATFSLGSRYAIENKDKMRPRLCILTTANHREINACIEKPENGVNGDPTLGFRPLYAIILTLLWIA